MDERFNTNSPRGDRLSFLHFHMSSGSWDSVIGFLQYVQPGRMDTVFEIFIHVDV